MKPGLKLTEGALITVWLASVAASCQAPSEPGVSFDQSGRMILDGGSGAVLQPADDQDPPNGPPNIQCPC